MNEKNKAKDIKFEVALKKVEDIVAKLEDGDLDLEKSIELFEEGVTLSKVLQKKLDEAEKKIEKLVRDRGGELSTDPMEDPTDDAPI